MRSNSKRLLDRLIQQKMFWRIEGDYQEKSQVVLSREGCSAPPPELFLDEEFEKRLVAVQGKYSVEDAPELFDFLIANLAGDLQ